ncbi:MAG TPA: arsenite efflux transporter metallochaperone ArsD [Methanoregulaceae archaeon]|nr:arsenite efflux transporter metallochaperone ArsD [Methanoregulaceae archaeon]
MTKDTMIIFEGALCCSTGICGPEPNKALIELNENLKRLKSERPDVEITRASLTFNLETFLENNDVLEMVKAQGPDILPVTTLNGKVVTERRYPTYEEFLALLNRERERV